MKSRVSSTVTKRKPNPRPRKYASASERQAAYRARAPEVCFRAEQKTVETLDRIADTIDRSRAELLLSMTKFALTNHDWERFGLTHKTLPRYEEHPMLHEFARIGKPFSYDGRAWKVTAYDHVGETIEAATTDRKSPYRRERINVSELMTTRRPLKKNPAAKRAPTPAQLAARERFAEMARSGALAKGRKRNPATLPPYIMQRIQAGIDTGLLTKNSTYAVVEGVVGFVRGQSQEDHEKMIAAAMKVLREKTGRKTNPAKGITFYVHANLGYGKSAHFKVTASPGANSARSAANEVAAHLGYPVFVGSRNERPMDGYPVIRYEFVDDAQTKAVDLFVYQVKREGVKYSTIRKTNPARKAAGVKSNPVKYRDIAKGVPPARVQYAVHMPDRPSYHAMAYFTKKADAVETAQEVSDRTGKPIAVTRVQVHFGPL